MAQAQYTYPEDLGDKPKILFTARDKSGSPTLTVALYAPPSITVSDNMGYGNYDLGVIGQAAMNIKEDADGNVDNAALIKMVKEESAKAGSEQGVLLKALSNAGFGSALGDKIANVQLQKNKIAINPNTVLQFTGPELRSFGFSFTLVPTGSTQSNRIKEMISKLRERMYSSKRSEIILEYPDSFTVKFLLGGNFVPQYAESYLTGMTATYNAAGNSYHTDGTPTDVTIQLQFSEFRALNREDIVRLNDGEIVTIPKSTQET